MSMQLIHGKALSEIIAAEGPLDPQRATGVIIAIASAMESAHQCNVIHHDLKPANILMDGNTGQPVITDFGVSTSEYQQQGANGREPGTPSYMAPECFDDNANENGPAGDIFSAGAVLYEMLTARKAFGGPVEYVIEQLLNDPPRRPADYDSRIPLELESICLKALSRDPATRFESMRALETALRSLNFDPFVTGPALA